MTESEEVKLDGSEGEGGGQILRSALALSMLSGRPFEIVRVRAGRPKPGLRPQHLESVRAARAACNGQVEGDRVGSRTLRFVPGRPCPGEYTFTIGTAGSAALVLQTVYLPLALEASASITIVGGTHVPFAPCFDYLVHAWLPALVRLGLNVRVELERCGFYPAGGGRLTARLRATGALRPLDLLERGPIEKIQPVSMVGRVPLSIAERQARRALSRLAETGLAGCTAQPIIEDRDAAGPGTMLGLVANFAHSQTFFYALGARGKPAETVADEAVADLLQFLEAPGAPVDPHLADQLLLPLAAGAKPSRFRTSAVTSHLVTNASVIERFLPVKITIAGRLGKPADVSVS